MMRILVILCLIFGGYQASANNEKITWFSFCKDPHNFAHIEQRLRTETINRITKLNAVKKDVKATHKISVITLESGLKGVFKTGNYHYAEVAAYRLSKLLGLYLVPLTVFRTIEGKQGSLQLYIDAPDLASASDSHTLLKRVGKKAISDMKLFYYVAGQWDTHAGNQIVFKDEEAYRLQLIDNSGMLHRSYSRYGGVTFIEKGENSEVLSEIGAEFPFDKAITLKGDYYKTIEALFNNYITKAHIKALSCHETLTYSIWNHSLWMQRPRSSNQIFRYTKRYYQSTLNALKCLTKEDLESVWAEWLLVDPKHGHELIKLILARRDEVLLDAAGFDSIAKA